MGFISKFFYTTFHTKRCSVCGTEFNYVDDDWGSEKCPNCIVKQNPTAQPSRRLCRCGQLVKRTNNFCDVCGDRIGEPVSCIRVVKQFGWPTTLTGTHMGYMLCRRFISTVCLGIAAIVMVPIAAQVGFALAGKTEADSLLAAAIIVTLALGLLGWVYFRPQSGLIAYCAAAIAAGIFIAIRGILTLTDDTSNVPVIWILLLGAAVSLSGLFALGIRKRLRIYGNILDQERRGEPVQLSTMATEGERHVY